MINVLLDDFVVVATSMQKLYTVQLIFIATFVPPSDYYSLPDKKPKET